MAGCLSRLIAELDGDIAMEAERFIYYVGFSIVSLVTVVIVIWAAAYVLKELLRYINNEIADRLITLHGLVKMQSLYANRDRLTFVWRKEPDVNSDDAD